MTSFKEMLEKKKVNSYPDNSGVRRDTDYISIQALGQWALEKYMFYINYARKTERSHYPNAGSYIYTMPGGINELLTRASTYHEIAVACLGKKEVIKKIGETK